MESPPLELLPVRFTCLEREQGLNVGEGKGAKISDNDMISPSFHLAAVDSPPCRLDAAGLVTQEDILTVVVLVSASGLVVETSI